MRNSVDNGKDEVIRMKEKMMEKEKEREKEREREREKEKMRPKEEEMVKDIVVPIGPRTPSPRFLSEPSYALISRDFCVSQQILDMTRYDKNMIKIRKMMKYYKI